jgi:hypothetical protein
MFALFIQSQCERHHKAASFSGAAGVATAASFLAVSQCSATVPLATTHPLLLSGAMTWVYTRKNEPKPYMADRMRLYPQPASIATQTQAALRNS